MKIGQALRQEIEKDIKICNDYDCVDGSEKLYGALVAKYSVLDPNFSKNLSTNGKVAIVGKKYDFRPELNAISNKLQMILLLSDSATQNGSAENPLKLKVSELLERGKKIAIEEYHPAEDGFCYSYVSGPLYDAWMGEINIFNERHLKKHPLYQRIQSTYLHRKTRPSSCQDMIGYFEAIEKDHEFWNEPLVSGSDEKNNDKYGGEILSNKIFIVHGHDDAAKESMARALEKVGCEAIILHEQADAGLTIIEKIEKYTDVAFAVVLYTGCDVGRSKELDESENQFRARQNVVFEHGYLLAKLGRDNVCAFVKGSVETPGDISGVLYVPMDDNGAWKIKLYQNMKAAGVPIDTSKIL